MLAEIGFLATGICFAAFAYTFKTSVIDKAKLDYPQFSGAYFCLALALLTWGVAVAIGGDKLLHNAVLLGDWFLLLGSLFMLDILLGAERRLWLYLAGAIALVLLNYRGTHYSPMPYMRGGILIFNTQTPVAVGLAALFALIWLPANLRIAKMVTHKIKQDSIASVYSYIYIAATISALIFIAARRTATVIISFVALGICFLLLLGSNLLVELIQDKKPHGRAAKRA